MLFPLRSEDATSRRGPLSSNSKRLLPPRGAAGRLTLTVLAGMAEAELKLIHDRITRHLKVTFEEEFLALLRKHKVACDERFLRE